MLRSLEPSLNDEIALICADRLCLRQLRSQSFGTRECLLLGLGLVENDHIPLLLDLDAWIKASRARARWRVSGERTANRDPLVPARGRRVSAVFPAEAAHLPPAELNIELATQGLVSVLCCRTTSFSSFVLLPCSGRLLSMRARLARRGSFLGRSGDSVFENHHHSADKNSKHRADEYKLARKTVRWPVVGRQNGAQPRQERSTYPAKRPIRI